MVNFSPHRLATVAAGCCLLAVVAGAAVTSDPAALIYRMAHSAVSVVVVVLTFVLSLGLWRTERDVWVRRLAGGLFAVVALLAIPVDKLGSFRWFHAVAAQVLVGLVLTAAHVTSPRWLQGPSIVQDSGFPSLRSLSVFAAGLTLVQVILGAAFRHGATGIVPHVVGAIAVTIVLLILAAFVMTQFPNHTALVRSAWAMIGVVTVQIVLGVVAYVGRLSQIEGMGPSPGLVASTVAHVVFGAATLAAAFDLALKVHYHVRPRAAFESGLSAAL